MIDDHIDLSSPDGLFRKLLAQSLSDGYINELTQILKHLITIPVSGGDALWTNITQIVGRAVAPTRNGGSEYLTMSELDHLLKVRAQEAEHEKEREQKENALAQRLEAEKEKLGAERSKVAELEKQVQDLQGQLEAAQTVGGLPQFGGGGLPQFGGGLGGLPVPDYADSPQFGASGGGLPQFGGGGLPQFGGGGLGGLPPPDYPDSPSGDAQPGPIGV